MDEDIAWEKFQKSNDKRVVKGDASISGKLDTIAQMLAEQGTDTSRIAETVIPEIEGDRGAQDTQASEMAAAGGLPPAGGPPMGAPDAGAPDMGGEMPPEMGGEVPPEQNGEMPPEGMPEGAGMGESDESVPPEIPPAEPPEASPDVQEPVEEMPPAPEEAPMEGGMPMPEGNMEEAPVEDNGTPPGADVDMDFGGDEIDWSMFTSDGAFRDFMDTLADDAKEALDMGDTAKVVQITQVIEAMTALWKQSGLGQDMQTEVPAPEAGVPMPDETAEQTDTPDGVIPQDLMKSEGDAELDTGEDNMEKTEEVAEIGENPVEKAECCEGDMEKSDAVAGDELGDGETETLAASEAEEEPAELDKGCEKAENEESEGCEKSEDLPEDDLEYEFEAPMIKSMSEMLADRQSMDAYDMTEAYRLNKAYEDSLPVAEAPVIKSMSEMLGRDEPAEAPKEEKEEGEVIQVVKSSRPPSARSSSGDFMTGNSLENMKKSVNANVPESESDSDPVRKALKLDQDWANYMAQKHAGEF
jgi:hypothetical protein|nr:MAG TPA: hypothetical protein [Caudoviricetes sp.]